MLRHLTGPLPWFICKMGTFFAHLSAINACHITVLIVAGKCTYLYIFKSMPIINDDLLSFVIVIVIYAWGFFATSAKMLLDTKVPLSEVILDLDHSSDDSIDCIFSENLHWNLAI